MLELPIYSAIRIISGYKVFKFFESVVRQDLKKHGFTPCFFKSSPPYGYEPDQSCEATRGSTMSKRKRALRSLSVNECPAVLAKPTEGILLGALVRICQSEAHDQYADENIKA